MADPFDSNAPLDTEIAELLQRVYQKFGADYRNYSPTFLNRRLNAHLAKQGFDSLEELEEKIFVSEDELNQFFSALSLPTTRMFRDAYVFKEIRQYVIPYLSQTHFTKVWSAGCSTGEEAYSLSILLKEEKPDSKILTYATDMNEKSLYAARKGIYQLRKMRAYTVAYLASGGTGDFSDYYTSDHENAMMNADLKRNIVFAQHNLVTDSSFNEFDLILCRNVLIYFNRDLQAHVLSVLQQSLRPGGILVLGDKESLRSIVPVGGFKEVDRINRIYVRAN